MSPGVVDESGISALDELGLSHFGRIIALAQRLSDKRTGPNRGGRRHSSWGLAPRGRWTKYADGRG